MVERKLYKTRLCLLYQRGRCSRQYCNFAHGSAELRRSFNGRREYHGRDLRESLGRNRSPLREYSPRRDDRARHSSHGNSPRSPMRRIDRNHRKRQRFDGTHDYSGSMRMSDGNEDQNRERTWTPSDSKMLLDEQLRHMLTEIKILDNDKQKLEIFLEEKVQEADALTSKIHDLEMQLSKEKEEAKRVNTKIKKFIKTHNRHLRLKEELKRSHAQVSKLGDQLGFNAVRQGSNEEQDSKINAVSEDETGVNNVSPLNWSQINSSPSLKKSRGYLETHDAANQVNIVKGDRTEIWGTRLEKPSRHTERREQLILSKESDTNNRCGPLAYEDKPRRGTYQPPDVASANKVPEMGLTLPSTGLAAHALDEYFEDPEMDEKFRVTGPASTRTETDVTLKFPVLPFPPPPPPPVPQDVYSQYEGDDEHVEIDELDEEMMDVDII